MRYVATLALALTLALAAQGVLIDSGDGTGNTGTPPDDPGWAHVGVTASNLTATVNEITCGVTLDGMKGCVLES